MKELGNGIDFEVLKFCQRSQAPCKCCGSCEISGKVKIYGLELPAKIYSFQFQKSVDDLIDEIVVSKGVSREEAIAILMEEDVDASVDELCNATGLPKADVIDLIERG